MLYKIKKRNKYKYGDLTIPILILFFILVIILRNAWVSEDAYITFRTVDNFVNGYGLTFNVGERVQGYTNPLLLFIMSLLYLLTNDVFYTSMILLSLVSIFAIGIAFLYVSESNANTILGASFLVFSKSFIDFSTSGLENPLTHLIIVFFFSVYIGRNLKLNSAKTVFLLSLLSALALINRMDTIILFIPPLIYVFYLEIKNQKINFLQLFKFTFLGFLPYFIWVGFALLYYGFPFPNTAYAKLSTGISNSELIKQGFIYFSHTLDRDPLTIVGIALGIIAVIVVRSKKYMPFILGILLYLFYIIKIGGCFMAGRFFTAPLLLSVLLFMHIRMIPKRQVNLIYLITVFFVIIGIALPFNPVLSNSEYEGYGIVSGGIADERGFYYNYTGLLRSRITEHHWVINGTKLKEEAEKHR